MNHGREAKRLEEWGALAGGLAHEIKNPLSTINITLHLLREDLTSRETIATAQPLGRIELLITEVEHLQRILEEFLRLTREPTVDAKDTDLNSIAEDTVDFLEPEFRTHGVDMVTQLDRSVKLVRADPTLFRQALLNLLRNGLNAMPQGGTLTLSTRRVDDRYVVEVIDTGVGMSPELQERIFDGFFSTRPKGSGIGLTLTKQIAVLHGGDVHCESVEGRGSRFTLELPINGPSNASS